MTRPLSATASGPFARKHSGLPGSAPPQTTAGTARTACVGSSIVFQAYRVGNRAGLCGQPHGEDGEPDRVSASGSGRSDPAFRLTLRILLVSNDCCKRALLDAHRNLCPDGNLLLAPHELPALGIRHKRIPARQGR